ncbi:MAG: hypothetical protein WC390_07300 [Sulfurimonas sp.]|jgi:hypothetical protein
MNLCDCTLNYTNTGVPNCKELLDAARMLILVPTYQADGSTRNKIATGDTLNDAYFIALINQADSYKRWYPLPKLDNVEDNRADAVYWTNAAGKKIFVSDAPRTFKALIMKEPVQLKEKLDNWGCLALSAFIVDKAKQLHGDYDGTDLYPFLIDMETFYAKLMKPTDTIPQHIELTFEFDESIDDGNIRHITQTELGCDLLAKTGLKDVTIGAATGLATTTATVTLSLAYGSFKTAQKCTDLAKTDFVLYNDTDDSGHAAPITLTSATESPDGTYALVFPAQTSSDVMYLTGSHNGFEFNHIHFTIP